MIKNSIPTNESSRNSHDSKNQNTLLYKDKNLLTELIQLSHQHYKDQSPLSEEAFIAFLRGFIRWLETTCQTYKPMTIDDHIHSIEFHRHIYKNLWKRVPTLDSFFNATAYLMQYGVEIFRAQNYPTSYETFLNQLEILFNNDTIIKTGKQRTVYLLLEQLRQKPL